MFKDLVESSNYARKEIKVDETKGAQYRWANKKIKDEKLLFSPSLKSLENVVAPNYGTLTITNERTKINKETMVLDVLNDVENMAVRPSCRMTINLKDLDLSKYNRIRMWIYLEAVGFQNMYVHFSCANDGEEQHAFSVYANQWNEILWEISDLKRDNVNKIIIQPFLFGCPPEGLPRIKFYVDNIYADVVDKDYEFGWDLDERIAYSHSGYFTDAKKIALVQNMKDDYFYIIDENNTIVYKNKKQEISTVNGTFEQLDFSDLKTNGRYFIKYDNSHSDFFIIDENPFDESILKSLNFMRSLRCGKDVEGVHSACHLNCRSTHVDGRSVPNFGGWHDAGDLSQFEIPTAEITSALVDLALNTNDLKFRERILEEAKIGSDWLLQTTFHDGTRCLSVLYKLWRDNVLDPNNKSMLPNTSENGPFENFLSSAALASMAIAMKDTNKIYSDWCLRIAIEDFNFACDGYEKKIYSKRWGPNIDSVVCGHGIIAATELYKMTNDEKYIKIAKDYAKIVLACQESNYPNWDKPIRGFFDEDVEHKYILSYEHRGHEQSPIQGLCRLYQLLPNDNESSRWLEGIKLYKEYIMSTIFSTAPYGFLPGHIYDLDKINIKRVTYTPVAHSDEEAMEILKGQVKQGIKLSENVYLRRFPIAVQRRGFHATLLSKCKGVSEVAYTLNDKELMQICINQLEWILGKNPFASSTMYGEGYNYHPLYVAYSRQMVGALPVGIKTKGDFDVPYWPTIDNAVFKEIWGHTTGKYLWVLADIKRMKNTDGGK